MRVGFPELEARKVQSRSGIAIGRLAKVIPVNQMEATAIFAANIALVSLYLNGRDMATNCFKLASTILYTDTLNDRAVKQLTSHIS